MLKSVFIQTKTTCNSRCLICPYKDTYLGKPVKEMSGQLYKKILIDLGKDYEGEIGLYFQYEPLTDMRLPGLIAGAKLMCPKAKVIISTNAGLLNKEWRDNLIDDDGHGLDAVYFNILGGTKQTYEKMMPPLKWETMLENVREFAKVFKGDMFVNFVKTDENQAEVENLRKELPGSVGIVDQYWASDRGGTVKINKPSGAYTRFVKSDKECIPLRDRLYIYYDGKVPLCCQCWRREVIIGDVNKENLWDIYKSPKKHTRYEICQRCN